MVCCASSDVPLVVGFMQEQRKVQQRQKVIKDSRQKVEDMLQTGFEKYEQEEAQLETAIARQLSKSATEMAGTS